MGNKSFRDIYQQLVWPAIAGNVLWAIFSIIIREMFNHPLDAAARLATLLLLTFYVYYSFKKADQGKGNCIDYLHALTIIGFAIALESNSWLIKTSMTVMFIFAALGHWSGKWAPNNIKERKWPKKLLVGLIYIFGILICWYFPKNLLIIPHLNSLASLIFVLGVWYLFRDKIYDRFMNKT